MDHDRESTTDRRCSTVLKCGEIGVFFLLNFIRRRRRRLRRHAASSTRRASSTRAHLLPACSRRPPRSITKEQYTAKQYKRVRSVNTGAQTVYIDTSRYHTTIRLRAFRIGSGVRACECVHFIFIFSFSLLLSLPLSITITFCSRRPLKYTLGNRRRPVPVRPTNQTRLDSSPLTCAPTLREPGARAARASCKRSLVSTVQCSARTHRRSCDFVFTYR